MCCDNYFELLRIAALALAEGGRNRLRRGFSMIEVMVVVVIIAIVALMAVPMFSSAAGMQISTASEMIAADLEYAKSMAITTGQNYAVVFTNSTAESYKIVIVDPNGATPTIWHPVKKGFLYSINFKNDSRLNNVDIVSAQFQPNGANTITFDYLGSPYSGTGSNPSNSLNSGSIIISANGATATICVEPVTGYISITN